MSTPNIPSDLERAVSLERQDRTRIGAQGELSFHIGSLMQELRSFHLISQIDRMLEFPNPEVITPDVFYGRDIDAVSVTLGELHVREDFAKRVKAHTETHLSIRLQSANETLVITRSSDPEVDPDDIHDYVIVTDPSQTSPDKIMFLEQNVSHNEINAALVSLVVTDTQSAKKFSSTNFLSVPSFLAISDELELKASYKQVIGVHSFNDNHSELEFEQLDQHESFKLTHTVDSPTPRSIATSALSSVDFSMRFFIAEGRDVRSVIPDIKDIEILKKVALEELNVIRRKARRKAGLLPKILPINGIEIKVGDNKRTRQVEETIDETIRINRAADDLGIEELLRGALDQDGFDTPDTGTA
jgi:hypothetical protein